MFDERLVGVWSNDALHGAGAQSDERLVLLPDGTGRYEVYNWQLCSSERFRWETPAFGILRLWPEGVSMCPLA